MEEVWGNISLPSLYNTTPTTKPSSLAALNSGTNFHDFFNNKDPCSDQQRLGNYPEANSLSNINPSSSSVAKKRPPTNEDASADRRRLRLIKNRESADRSRARRQAYTNELEQEIENLKKENARLRQELEKAKPEMVSIVAAAATTTKTVAAASSARQLKSTKRNPLYRTLTAPF